MRANRSPAGAEGWEEAAGPAGGKGREEGAPERWRRRGRALEQRGLGERRKLPGRGAGGWPGAGREVRARSLAWCAQELGDHRGKSCLAGQGPGRASRLEAGDLSFGRKFKNSDGRRVASAR